MLCTIPASYLLIVLDQNILKKQAELNEMRQTMLFNALLFAHLLFCVITITIIITFIIVVNYKTVYSPLFLH